MITQAQAIAQGYKIDSTAAGRPYAYKGPRFAPEQGEQVLTTLEAELIDVLGGISNACTIVLGSRALPKRLRPGIKAIEEECEKMLKTARQYRG